LVTGTFASELTNIGDEQITRKVKHGPMFTTVACFKIALQRQTVQQETAKTEKILHLALLRTTMRQLRRSQYKTEIAKKMPRPKQRV